MKDREPRTQDMDAPDSTPGPRTKPGTQIAKEDAREQARSPARSPRGATAPKPDEEAGDSERQPASPED